MAGRGDLVVCLGDFNAVSGLTRIDRDVAIGPHSSGTMNDNSERMVAFCRKTGMRIGGSWFRRKDIHRLSWYSNDGHTKKEIDHVLVNTRWNSLMNCRVYRSLEFPSNHRPVVATIKIHIKIKRQTTWNDMKKFNSYALKEIVTAKKFKDKIKNILVKAIFLTLVES